LKGESTYFRSIAGAYLPYRHGFDRVVIIVTNHSHDTGDMYLGPNLCTSVDDVSIPTCGSGPLLRMAGYSSPQGGYKLLV